MSFFSDAEYSNTSCYFEATHFDNDPLMNFNNTEVTVGIQSHYIQKYLNKHFSQLHTK